MQVDNTNVIVDRTEDPFKDFGSGIIGNIVDYNNSCDEEEEKEHKKEDVSSKKKFETMSTSIETATTSAPIARVIVKPSTPPT